MAEDEKFFIRVHTVVVPVSEEVFRTYHREKRREKTLGEKDERNGKVSFDAMDNCEILGVEMIPDVNSPSVEDAAISAVLIAQMYQCIELLSESERSLLKALYFDNISEREFAASIGVSQKTINKRRHIILKKLKKYMKI